MDAQFVHQLLAMARGRLVGDAQRVRHLLGALPFSNAPQHISFALCEGFGLPLRVVAVAATAR